MMVDVVSRLGLTYDGGNPSHRYGLRDAKLLAAGHGYEASPPNLTPTLR